ncbi:hypothetical protein SAMN05421664_3250 [Chryseobacterium soldanellicola]|uniref:Uncharacterized protein n=1 Tax=Chryseobacterium soldanellicola TaxID=311333 RepID=A0A1H1FTC8_9FLAO|nr:hypothetical protein SAMN05421664_3250 [Chryseobacterium soldanellicola]
MSSYYILDRSVHVKAGYTLRQLFICLTKKLADIGWLRKNDSYWAIAIMKIFGGSFIHYQKALLLLKGVPEYYLIGLVHNGLSLETDGSLQIKSTYVTGSSIFLKFTLVKLKM